MVRLMDSALILYHVKMQILFAPVASVSAIVASEILAVTVLKVIHFEKSSPSVSSITFGRAMQCSYCIKYNENIYVSIPFILKACRIELVLSQHHIVVFQHSLVLFYC